MAGKPQKKICVHLIIQDTSHRRIPRLNDQHGLNSWHTIPWYRPSLPYFFSSSAPFSSFSPSFFSFLFPLTFLATTAFPKSPIVSPVIVLSPLWVMRKSCNYYSSPIPLFQFILWHHHARKRRSGICEIGSRRPPYIKICLIFFLFRNLKTNSWYKNFQQDTKREKRI
jgi:hypothetical protein